MDSANGVGPSGTKRDQEESNNPRPDKFAGLSKEYTIPPRHHLISHALADNYTNYIYTGVPSRIMIFEEGGWMELPETLSQPFIVGFRDGRSSVNFSVNGEQFLLIDFLSMVLINVRINKVQSVAWMDETGKCFLPNMALLQEATPPAEFDAWILACGGQMPSASSLHLQESEAPITHQPLLYPVVARLQRNSARFLAVQEMFLSGMGLYAKPESILDIFGCNGLGRMEAFERQMEVTARERGNANVKYGWYGTTDNNIVEALVNGFSHSVKLSEVGVLGTGVYLTPQDRAFASVRLCEVGRDRVQHMLLCRVIMGNVEQVQPGSKQYFPSSRNYDLGVDNALNPKCYVVWSTHLDRYVHPEYIVRFALSSRNQEYLCGLKDIRFHVEDNKVWYEMPGSLEPFILLFEEIRDRISPWARRLFLLYFEEFKRNGVTREALIMKMGSVVRELLPGFETAAERRNEHVGSSTIHGNTSAPAPAPAPAPASSMESTSAEVGRGTLLALTAGNTSVQVMQPDESAQVMQPDESAQVMQPDESAQMMQPDDSAASAARE